MKAVDRILCTPAGTLETLDRRCSSLASLDQILAELLGPPLAGHCHVANIKADTLVLHADSPAWASRLRFMAPELAGPMARHAHGASLRHVRVVVRAPVQAPTPLHPSAKARLSQRSADLLRATADDEPDPGLKKALRRLASRYADQ